jgi:hypothetical protein
MVTIYETILKPQLLRSKIIQLSLESNDEEQCFVQSLQAYDHLMNHRLPNTVANKDIICQALSSCFNASLSSSNQTCITCIETVILPLQWKETATPYDKLATCLELFDCFRVFMDEFYLELIIQYSSSNSSLLFD